MQKLHLSDNYTLYPEPNHKFSQVRTLIEKLNKHCLLQYLPGQTVNIEESVGPYCWKAWV